MVPSPGGVYEPHLILTRLKRSPFQPLTHVLFCSHSACSEFGPLLAFQHWRISFLAFKLSLYIEGILLYLIQHVYVPKARGGLPRTPQFASFRVISTESSFIHSFNQPFEFL